MGDEPSAAVLAAKQRQRGPTVLERLAAEQAAASVAVERGAKRSKGASGATIRAAADDGTCGGKSRKTGMVLARAELAESPSGVGAARDRQVALVGKKYRKAESVARETAVGMLATKEMPRRKGSTESSEQFKQKFFSWMRGSLTGKVKQVRTAAAYEKMVLTVNEWTVQQGYAPFCHVVEVAEQRYRVELLVDDDGVPMVPQVEAIIQFIIGMTTGEVEKGGSREARDKEWRIR